MTNMKNSVKVPSVNRRSIVVTEDGKLIVSAPNCYAGAVSGNTKKFMIDLKKNKELAVLLMKVIINIRKGTYPSDCGFTTVRALVNFEEERKFSDLFIAFEYRDEIGEIVMSTSVDNMRYLSVALPSAHGNGYIWSREIINCKAVDNAYVRILAILTEICSE